MWLVIEDVRFSSEVLPIMGIVTLSFVMFFIEGTPFSLKVEHVKISVSLHKMNYSSLYVFRRVSERAELSVIAFMQFFREFCTELSLILFFMVKTFHSIMGKSTRVFELTLICIWKFTHVSFKLKAGPFSVFKSVVKPALLMIVLMLNNARLCFKCI